MRGLANHNLPDLVRLPLTALVLGLALAACTDPVDRAAKQRIFSPEDPPKVIAAAGENLPVDALASDPRVEARVLRMGAAEVTERLGAHRYTGAVTFEWTGNGDTETLSEQRLLLAAPGGFKGDFDARIQNTRDQGLEVLRISGKVFAKDLYGRFRERLRDRGMAERTRTDVEGALKDFDAIFDHRLRLEDRGAVTYEERKAERFTVSLGPPPPVSLTAVNLPPPQYARAGLDDATKRRLAFTRERKVQTLRGELLVDPERSVVLKARLDGKLDAPGGPGGPAVLHMTLESAITRIGEDPRLAVPTQFLPDEDKPTGIADALDRFGIPRGNHTDAGVDSELPDEEPPAE